MSITQRQLADRLGVSQMAVSFAINNKPGVNDESRRRILEAAEQAGYRPNVSARATRNGKTGNVELVMGLHESVSRLPVGLLDSVHDALAAADFRLLVSRMSDAALVDEQGLPRMLRERAADGLLINYTHGYPEQFRGLVERFNIPAVWLNSPVNTNCVRPDDVMAGRLAAEHLLAAGHRRIAMFVVGGNDHHSVASRTRGFSAAVKRAGLEPVVHVSPARPYHQIRQDLCSDERLALADAWLNSPDRPDAVVAYSIAEINVLVVAAARRGLRLRDDLALVGIADEVPPSLGAPVTTVVLPWADIGRAAVEAMVGICAGELRTPVELRELPPTLVQGVTTRPAATGQSAPPRVRRPRVQSDTPTHRRPRRSRPTSKE